MTFAQSLTGDLAQRAWSDVSTWSDRQAERRYRELCNRQAPLVAYASEFLEDESDAVFALAIDLLMALDHTYELAAGEPVASVREDIVVAAVTSVEETPPSPPRSAEVFIGDLLASSEFSAPELPATFASLVLAALDTSEAIDEEEAAVLLAFICISARIFESGQGISPTAPAGSAAAGAARVTPKVGRNEPCPCGSGKKFKRCCQQHEHAPQVAALSSGERRLLDYLACAEEVMAFAESDKGSDAAWHAQQRALFEEEFPVGEDGLVPDSIFFGHSLFDLTLPRAGVCMGALYGRRRGRQLDARARRVLRELCDSHLAFYELTGSHDGIPTFRELVSGESWRGCDPDAPEDFDFESGEVWLCRFVGPHDDAITFGEPLVYPPEALADIEEMLAALLQDLGDASSDSDPVSFSRTMKNAGGPLASYIASTAPDGDEGGDDWDEISADDDRGDPDGDGQGDEEDD